MALRLDPGSNALSSAPSCSRPSRPSPVTRNQGIDKVGALLSPKRLAAHGLPELCRVESQICQAAHVKEHALPSIYKTQEYVVANGAPRHDAGSLHI